MVILKNNFSALGFSGVLYRTKLYMMCFIFLNFLYETIELSHAIKTNTYTLRCWENRYENIIKLLFICIN